MYIANSCVRCIVMSRCCKMFSRWILAGFVHRLWWIHFWWLVSYSRHWQCGKQSRHHRMSRIEHIYHMRWPRTSDWSRQSCLYNKSIKSCLSCECMHVQNLVNLVICQTLDFAFSDRSCSVLAPKHWLWCIYDWFSVPSMLNPEVCHLFSICM